MSFSGSFCLYCITLIVLRISIIFSFFLFLGCKNSLINYETRSHIVRPNETLYAIAWQYGIDYQDLARWNRLSSPDIIQIGQHLRLSPIDSIASVATTSMMQDGPEFRAWQWPTAGSVVSVFGADDGVPTGIGIEGQEGQIVRASSSGQVVYAGGGLVGYGELVILKHDQVYLSAYGYNRKLLVRQGDIVARGQEIAEMGLGPERSPRLHFEIRRSGVPIKPSELLNLAPRMHD